MWILCTYYFGYLHVAGYTNGVLWPFSNWLLVLRADAYACCNYWKMKIITHSSDKTELNYWMILYVSNITRLLTISMVAQIGQLAIKHTLEGLARVTGSTGCWFYLMYFIYNLVCWFFMKCGYWIYVWSCLGRGQLRYWSILKHDWVIRSWRQPFG